MPLSGTKLMARTQLCLLVGWGLTFLFNGICTGLDKNRIFISHIGIMKKCKVYLLIYCATKVNFNQVWISVTSPHHSVCC